MADDTIQHGIDDDPNDDAKKGATIGGIGGAVTGAAAGSMAGPLGAVAGAVIGGVAGAVASGAAVGAVDKIDNDDTVTGVGDGTTRDFNNPNGDTAYDRTYDNTTTGRTYDTTDDTVVDDDLRVGNGVPGIQTGGHTVDGSPDTRGIIEKTEDAVTGDIYDDKTGRRVA